MLLLTVNILIEWRECLTAACQPLRLKKLSKPYKYNQGLGPTKIGAAGEVRSPANIGNVSQSLILLHGCQVENIVAPKRS